MTKVATVKLIVATRITNINNSGTMISYVTPYLYKVGMSKLFAHSVLVLMAPSMALSNFLNGPIRSNTVH